VKHQSDPHRDHVHLDVSSEDLIYYTRIRLAQVPDAGPREQAIRTISISGSQHVSHPSTQRQQIAYHAVDGGLRQRPCPTL